MLLNARIDECFALIHLRHIDSFLDHIDDTGAFFPRWMACNFGITPDLIRSTIGCVEVDVAPEDNGSLACKECRYGRAITPAVLANAADACDQDDLVAEVVERHVELCVNLGGLRLDGC